ncbi:hypothetical protein [Ralstonia syzygii]|uniref:hypothetical protein n=1 Tax=Ralstonia syzygii TaxID=28097 RepID=UPI0027DB7342|nr:hypothetical protein [Ralstonia syzygii]
MANRRAFESSLSEAWRRGAHAESPLSCAVDRRRLLQDFNDRSASSRVTNA